MADNADNIVSLNERRPHVEGRARCMHCEHEWDAVAPVGTTRLTCEACGLKQGAFINAIGATAGQSYWRCNCGNDLFLLLRHTILCAHCGIEVKGYP